MRQVLARPHPPSAPARAILSSLVLGACAFLSGCGEAPHPQQPTANSFDYEPHGSQQEIAEACQRAGFAMSVFTADEFSPAESYLDPRGLSGYDPKKKERNARAAKYLNAELQAQNVEHFGEVTRWFDTSIEELGWQVLSESEVKAGEYAWSNLQNRLDWCVDHFNVNITARETPAVATTSSASARPAEPAVDPYRTEVHAGIAGGDPIVIEHQPD